MLEGTWASDAGAEQGEGSETRAGAVVVPLTGAVAAAVAAAGSAVVAEVLVAAEGVLDEEVLPCDWVEKVAEAWNCAKLWPHNYRRGGRKDVIN